MTDSIFKEGGPHKIRRTGHDQYSMNISIPEDADGRVARECPNDFCSPGYFKVTQGTGITEGHDQAFALIVGTLPTQMILRRVSKFGMQKICSCKKLTEALKKCYKMPLSRK